jgi:hypothetical protein
LVIFLEKKGLKMPDMDYAYRYLDAEGDPLKECPGCGHDLTEDDGISISLSVSDHVFSVSSRLDAEGNLVDTPDGAVSAGLADSST